MTRKKNSFTKQRKLQHVDGDDIQQKKHHGHHGHRSRHWNVVHKDSLPHFLKDNEYLHDGHRPQLHTILACCKSVFRIHTETCNIWTHFIGAIGTLLLAIYYFVYFVNDWQHGAAFSVFFIGAITCMGASTAYHILGCHSEEMANLWAKLDYCGIIVLICTSFAPWVYFGFYCHGHGIKTLYIGGVTTLGIACIYFVTHEQFKQPKFRALRAGLFIALGLTGIFPGVHYIVTDGLTVGYHGWLLFMAALYIAGGIIYAARIPERLWPGKFDIWCQSHQILHICVMAGVLVCYNGASKLAHHRLVFGNCASNTSSSWVMQDAFLKAF